MSNIYGNLAYSLHFVGGCTDCKRQQLVPQTNSEYRFNSFRLEQLLQIVDGLCAQLRISWTVAEEDGVAVYGEESQNIKNVENNNY